jgi:hypothetical protein
MQFSVEDMDTILDAVGSDALLNSTSVKVKYRPNSLNEMGVLTDRPQATMKASLLASVNLKTATLTVAGETFRMVKPLPDGTGFVIVGLTRI